MDLLSVCNFYYVFFFHFFFIFFFFCFSFFFFFFQAEDGIRDLYVTGVQTCALPISGHCCPSKERNPTLTPGATAPQSSFERKRRACPRQRPRRCRPYLRQLIGTRECC